MLRLSPNAHSNARIARRNWDFSAELSLREPSSSAPMQLRRPLFVRIRAGAGANESKHLAKDRVCGYPAPASRCGEHDLLSKKGSISGNHFAEMGRVLAFVIGTALLFASVSPAAFSGQFGFRLIALQRERRRLALRPSRRCAPCWVRACGALRAVLGASRGESPSLNPRAILHARKA